jgi:hypothetical protein
MGLTKGLGKTTQVFSFDRCSFKPIKSLNLEGKEKVHFCCNVFVGLFWDHLLGVLMAIISQGLGHKFWIEALAPFMEYDPTTTFLPSLDSNVQPFTSSTGRTLGETNW